MHTVNPRIRSFLCSSDGQAHHWRESSHVRARFTRSIVVKAETVLRFPCIQAERVRATQSPRAIPLPLVCLNDEICRKPEESRMLYHACGDQQIQEGSCDDKSGKHAD